MPIPDWLTRRLVERALRTSMRSDLDVTTMVTRTFDDSDDYFNSNLSRIIANTTEGQRYLIAKTMPASSQAKRMVQEAHMFRREATMYGSIIPELHEMLAGRLDEDGEPLLKSPFAPGHVYNGKRPKKYILLDDMTASGFHRADRHEGLDMPHALLAMRTLAVFHGVSAAFLREFRIAIHKLENPYALLKYYVRTQIQQTFRRVAAKCREMENFRAFAGPIEELMQGTTTKLVECHSHRGARFNVICHGDFRVSNLMFSYEGDEVREIRFLDFQLSHVTSPAADLLMFLSTSLSKEVYKSARSVLIKEYHRVLSNTLLAFDLQPPPLGLIVEILHANSIIAVYTSIAIAPIVKASIMPEEEAALREGNYNNCHIYDIDDVQEWIKLLLEELAGWKWINVSGFKKVRWETDMYQT